MKVVELSAAKNRPPLPPENIPDTLSVRGWFDPGKFVSVKFQWHYRELQSSASFNCTIAYLPLSDVFDVRLDNTLTFERSALGNELEEGCACLWNDLQEAVIVSGNCSVMNQTLSYTCTLSAH